MMDINPCPNPECHSIKCFVSIAPGYSASVRCSKCKYRGPTAEHGNFPGPSFSDDNVRAEAIRLHNLISPQPSAPGQPVAYENALRWCYDRLEGAPEYTLTPREQGNTYKEIGNVLRGIESAAGSYEAGEFDASAKIPRHIASPASASPSAQPSKSEYDAEGLWRLLETGGYLDLDDGRDYAKWHDNFIALIGAIQPSAQPQPEEAINELIADGFIAAILHGDEKHQQWLKDFKPKLLEILSKHLKAAPSPSVAAEASDLFKQEV